MNGIMVWAWMLWSPYALEKHEGNYGLGMDALVAVCSWSTNGIRVLCADDSSPETLYGSVAAQGF